jgi:hypothetical protein
VRDLKGRDSWETQENNIKIINKGGNEVWTEFQ